MRVDRETGQIFVKKLVAAQDVGRALNPALCEGQIVGAAVQEQERSAARVAGLGDVQAVAVDGNTGMAD